MTSLPYSPSPLHVLLQDSPPYCVFRNLERYTTSAQAYRGAFWAPQSSKMMANRAWRCVRHKLYKSPPAGASCEDFDVPPKLLYDVALQDMADSQAVERHRRRHYMPCTLTRVLHDDYPLVVHAAGKHLDELVIRYVDECDLVAGAKAQTGFTLPLAAGDRVEDIYSCGPPVPGGCSQLLVKVAGALLYHLRTVEVDLANPSRTFRSSDVILEPLDSYQLPHAVLGVASGRVLCAGGRLYLFDPLRGVTPHASAPLPFVAGSSSSSVVKIEQTLHPMLSYISRDEQLYTCDLRVPTGATPARLYATPDSSPIESILQHGKRSDHFFLSHGSELSLMDCRYCKQPLSCRALPEAHTHMVFQSGEEMHSSRGASVDVVLGGSSGARQLLMHTLQLERHGGDSDGGDGVDDSILNWCLLSPKFTPFAATAAVLWATRGAPVVDRSSAHVSLAGVALSPLLRRPDDRKVYRRGNRGDDRQSQGGLPDRATTHHAYLLQQSSLGDVYMQRLSLWRSGGREPPPPVQRNLPCGVRARDTDTRARKEAKKAPGLMLVSDTAAADLHRPVASYSRGRYPQTADNFLPAMEEREVLRFDEILVHPSQIAARPRRKKRLALSGYSVNVTLFLTERLRGGPMSLYEAYTYLADISEPRDFPSLQALLDLLRQQQDMQQYLLPFSQQLVSKVCRSDLLQVNVKAGSSDVSCGCAEGLAARVKGDKELSSRLQPCSDRSCLLPHLIMFRLRPSGDGGAVTQPFTYESSEKFMNKKQKQRIAADSQVLLSGDILSSLLKKWDSDKYVQ